MLALIQLFSSVILQTDLGSVAAQVMPLVALAMLTDALIVTIWYYLGVMLNNNAVKGTALGEFYQLIGTGIMLVIILAVLVFVSTAMYSTLGATTLMSPTAIGNMCNGLKTGSQLDLIRSLTGGPTNNAGSFPGLCSLVSAGGTTTGGAGLITSNLDYPLAASTVVLANLTNQTAVNLNSSFTMDAWLGFLSKLNPEVNICIAVATGIPCLIPNPIATPDFDTHLEITPYAGYNMIYDNLASFGTLLNLSVQSFIGQLLVVSIFLYIWPYFIFGGILLRSTFLTRKLGGLLIAIAISGIIVFPMVFSFEYLSLGNGISVNGIGTNGLNTTYGFNPLTTLPANSLGTGTYAINFFVEPSVKGIAVKSNCWFSTSDHVIGGGFISSLVGATAPNLFGYETADIFYLLNPLLGGPVISSIKFIANIAFGSSNPTFPLPYTCTPNAALNMFFGMLDAYGLIGVMAYFVPIINIAITLTSVIGLSQLFGGDTSLAGLSRLV